MPTSLAVAIPPLDLLFAARVSLGLREHTGWVSVGLCNTLRCQSITDTIREYLISVTTVRYSRTPPCGNLYHKPINAALISCFTVSY